MKKVEQQLIRGLLSGDKSAFDMVFRTYYDTLLFDRLRGVTVEPPVGIIFAENGYRV